MLITSRRSSLAGWLHCYANLADMYKTQKRFEDASDLLARMPWLPSPQQASSTTAEAEAEAVEGGDPATEKTPPSNPGSGDQIPAVPLAAASRGTGDATTTTAGDVTPISASKSPSDPEDGGSSSPASKKEGTDSESSPAREHRRLRASNTQASSYLALLCAELSCFHSILLPLTLPFPS